MFLITEDDELGLVSAMMHEAAGGLELPDPAEPALSMLGGKKKKTFQAKSPAAFQKWKGSSCPKICVMTPDESPTESYIHIPLIAAAKPSSKRIGGRTWLQLLQTDPTINVVRPSGQER